MADVYYDLDPDTENDFKSTFNEKSFSVNIGLKFIGNSKLKQLVKITKIPDQYKYCIGKDLLVQINEDLLKDFDDEMMGILYEQEIDKILVDMKSGNIKLIKPDLNTFSGLVEKWGIEKVARANQVLDLTIQQKAEETV
jgi:hypothetical protein